MMYSNLIIACNFGITGLVGTISCAITRDDGDPSLPESTDGILEAPAGTGRYRLEDNPLLDSQHSYEVIWKSGTDVADDVIPSQIASGGGVGDQTIHITEQSIVEEG